MSNRAFQSRTGPLDSAQVRGVAQSGSAPVLGTGGRKFESCRPDHFIKRINQHWHGDPVRFGLILRVTLWVHSAKIIPYFKKFLTFGFGAL